MSKYDDFSEDYRKRTGVDIAHTREFLSIRMKHNDTINASVIPHYISAHAWHITVHYWHIQPMEGNCDRVPQWIKVHGKYPSGNFIPFL